MNTNQTRAFWRATPFLSLITAFYMIILGACTPQVPSIESTPDDGKGIARVEIPTGTYSFEVAYPDKVAADELVTLKDFKGHTSNLRMVANQLHEIRAEEPLSKGDRCKIIYYYKDWNNGSNRTCLRITACKVRPEVEKNFGDTPIPTVPPPLDPEQEK